MLPPRSVRWPVLKLYLAVRLIRSCALTGSLGARPRRKKYFRAIIGHWGALVRRRGRGACKSAHLRAGAGAGATLALVLILIEVGVKFRAKRIVEVVDELSGE